MAKKRAATSTLFSKRNLIWGGVTLFIAGWMFVLGILVGRGTAPVILQANKLQKELADLKAEVKQKEQDKLNSHTSGQGNSKSQLGFYEALKDPIKGRPLKRETPSKQVQKPKPKPAKIKKPPPPKQTQVKKPSPPKPAPKQQNRSADPKPKSKGHYTIQVSAVRDAGNADRLVAQLRGKGFPAYQVRVDTAGKGAWYRVRVGAFDDRGAANSMLAKLKASKHSGMVVGTK